MLAAVLAWFGWRSCLILIPQHRAHIRIVVTYHPVATVTQSAFDPVRQGRRWFVHRHNRSTHPGQAVSVAPVDDCGLKLLDPFSRLHLVELIYREDAHRLEMQHTPPRSEE